MPFADRDAGLPGVQKYDSRVDIVRDHVSGGFKAIVVSDLSVDDLKLIASEIKQWCTDPKSVVLGISTNTLVNWVEI